MFFSVYFRDLESKKKRADKHDEVYLHRVQVPSLYHQRVMLLWSLLLQKWGKKKFINALFNDALNTFVAKIVRAWSITITRRLMDPR